MKSSLKPAKAVRFFKEAQAKASIWSKDPDRVVGALLVDPKNLNVLSSGYNGFPRNVKETAERWERANKSKYIIHAERNAVVNAARCGVRLEGSVCVVCRHPCRDCAIELIQVGVTEIITLPPDLGHPRWGQSWRDAVEILSEANVALTYLSQEEIDNPPPFGFDEDPT